MMSVLGSGAGLNSAYGAFSVAVEASSDMRLAKISKMYSDSADQQDSKMLDALEKI